MTDPIDIAERLAGLSADHGPDGWPAVQMRDISALCDEVARLRAALAAQVPQWLPIESAPKDGTHVILFGNARWPGGLVPARDDVVGAIGEGYFRHGLWQFLGMIGEPTHYMPLPAAPGASPQPAALAVPASMALVPVQPTKAMREAPTKDRPGFSPNVAREVWAAMLAASQESATTRGGVSRNPPAKRRSASA